MTGSFRELVEHRELLVTCGPGGVGKTSSSAALGLAAAGLGRRVIVMTVDPARRLADALGLEPGVASDLPHRVELPDDGHGGELWAVMLDAGATFDRLVREQSGSESQADRVIRNRVYQAISKSLAGVQDYMAIERLHELSSSGEWDLVIVDTPPSRNAIDLLRAPDRLVSFLGHPIYRTLTAGQRTFAKLTDAASSVFLWAVRRLAGPQIVDDVVEFFRSIAGIESGLRRRAKEVAALLRAPSTAFVVVSSPRAEAIDESLHVIEALGAGRFPLGGVIANLVHPMPEPLTGLSDEEAADLDALEPGPLADHVAWHAELSALASDERRQLSMLSAATGDVPIVELALLDVDVHDLASLAVLADRLADAT